MIIIKNAIIYRTDESNRSITWLFFILGLFFPIIGAIVAGFRYTEHEHNGQAVWSGVTVGIIIRLLILVFWIYFVMFAWGPVILSLDWLKQCHAIFLR